MAVPLVRVSRWIALGCVLGLLTVAGGWWLGWLGPSGSRAVTAYFTSAVAVFPDNDVRILGVPVGRITSVHPEGPVVRVEMEIDDSVDVPAGATAVVVAPSLVTGRHVQLSPAYTGGPTMPDGAVIPVERTAIPLGVDELARAANELATLLGPDGVNRQGALSDLLDVGASNLAGNGQALNDTIGDLAQLSGTLAGSRDELFGTVTELQSFVSTLAANDAQVRQFTTQLADVSGLLAAEREDLGAALRELSVALGEIAGFIQDNRAVLTSNVDRLTEVTEVLVAQQAALAEILDITPTALNNVDNAYNAASGTLDVRLNIEELRLPPILLVCELVRRGTPTSPPPTSPPPTSPPPTSPPPGQLPPGLAETCQQLEPQLTGAVPLPSAAEVISALQSGQPPPLPLLAVPTVPRGQ